MKSKLIERSKLTPREKQIAELICEGLTNREIAEKLKMAEKTVKYHITHVFFKTNKSNRAKLIVSVKDGE